MPSRVRRRERWVPILLVCALWSAFRGIRLSLVLSTGHQSEDAAQNQAQAPPFPHELHTQQVVPLLPKEQSFALCLLIKDDNDILNEFIAYHYHVWNLRRIVVAIDPESKTTPSSIFQTWHDSFGLETTEWTDNNYMPQYFLDGRYHQVPSFLPQFIQQNSSASIWHAGARNSTSTMTQAQIQQDLLRINNHRFRQVTFVSHCYDHLRREGYTWTAHIDTDEYIVINPNLRARPRAVKPILLPPIPTAGSGVKFWKDMWEHYPKRLMKSCVLMPTLLYGAVTERTPTNATARLVQQQPQWKIHRFETLQWRHPAPVKHILNGLSKSIVNVATLPSDHPIFTSHRIHSVHQPLSHSINGTYSQICRHMTLKPDVTAVRLFPLTIHHYVGSLERYLSRQDLRRNLDIYQEKAALDTGHTDDGWITAWLESFVHEHGLIKVLLVLGGYYTKKQDEGLE